MDRISSESSEESLTPQEAYLHRVRGLVESVSVMLTDDEKRNVHHLIDHSEPAEGLMTLAWIIVEGRKRVPAATIASIRELTAGLVDPADLPADLDAHAEG